MNKTWIVDTEEDPETGELILPLPTDLMESQDWKTGDTIEWVENPDGSWIIRKVN